MSRTTSIASFVLFIALVGLLGCGGSNVPPGDTCAPGATQLCLCTASEQGVQTCNENATGWGPCAGCSNTPPADAGATDTSAPPEDSGQQCLTQYEKKCVDKDVYWFDSCGNQETKVESCEIGCAAGECAQGCVPKSTVKCVDGQPHFFDSCGVDGGVYGAKACKDFEFCKDTPTGDPEGAFCVKPYYNGNWSMTANPDTKEVCGLANSIYPKQTLELTVNGQDATGVVNIQGYTVNYVGTVEGKTLTLTGNYTQSDITGTIEHEVVIEVVFNDPNEFEGIHSDSFELDLLGTLMPCVVYWNVTGVKQ